MKNNIRTLRVSKGWSQTKLANESGVPRPHLSVIESGKITPTTKTSLNIAKALGCSVEDIFLTKV